MNPFEMVLGIVLIAGIVSIVKYRSEARHAARQERNGHASLDERRIAALEERVRVLESIVTDRRTDLKREIERL